MPKLTSQQIADRSGRLLVTVDGRIAIVLPVIADPERQADMIAKLVTVLESAGLGTTTS